ncbi:GyrI-like domain-containing protein [Streptomyces violascens]|uniref:GyrI-like domain-containing protein n=1 Tax=Streptomyces violascens TaxID=67381 RepID=UPI0036475DF3
MANPWQLISSHLARLEDRLAQAQSAVESLRELLARPAHGPTIEYRTVREQSAIGIREVVDRQDVVSWWQGALGELRGFVAARGLRCSGPICGLFASELLQDERGEALVFVPVDGDARPVGRIDPVVVPGAELAVAIHRRPPQTIDLTYGDLGIYAARHEIGVDGPLREFYLRGPLDVTDEHDWVTEVGWPIFRSNGWRWFARAGVAAAGPSLRAELGPPVAGAWEAGDPSHETPRMEPDRQLPVRRPQGSTTG